MNKGTAGAVAGLSGVVLGLLLGRQIPQKVEIKAQAYQPTQTTQGQTAQSKVPSFNWVSSDPYQNFIGVTAFSDDLAPGMKAFAGI